MHFIVSARKYRPRQFDELIGQDHIAKTLKNALKNDQLAHAFLFSGPRGVGKTSSARILAKVLNCENRIDHIKSCSTCPSCLAFEQNTSFNIFELDAASNNSVDHIRSLNDQVRIMPQQGHYKVYIIDEVHMLSTQAFNAFLKTLEEPPEYAIFILATTEKHKIIPTILSRCQIFDFKRIQIKDIVGQLEVIAEKENRQIDSEALHLIAEKADGAMRDALSIYDKMASSIEGAISYAEVVNSLNVLDYNYYFSIVDNCIREDLPGVMVEFDKIIKSGFEPEQFITGLGIHLRNLLMVKDVETAAILETSDSLKNRYENQSALTPPHFLLSALSIINNTDVQLPRSNHKRLSVEIALSRMVYLNRRQESLPEAPAATQKKKLTDADPKPVHVTPPQEAQSSPSAKKVKENVRGKSSKAKSKSFALSTNLDDLITGIKDDEARRKENQLPWTESSILSIIKSYGSGSDSESLKTAMTLTKVNLADKILTIFTPSNIYIDFLKQEIKLMNQLHQAFPGKDFNIVFDAKPELFPDYEQPHQPKYLSTKEKYDLLSSKNPNFPKLVDDFKMKPAND